MWWYTVRINFRIFWMVTPMGWGHDLYPRGALSLDLLIKFLTRGWFQTQTNKNAKFTRRVTAVAVLQRSGPVLKRLLIIQKYFTTYYLATYFAFQMQQRPNFHVQICKTSAHRNLGLFYFWTFLFVAQSSNPKNLNYKTYKT